MDKKLIYKFIDILPVGIFSRDYVMKTFEDNIEILIDYLNRKLPLKYKIDKELFKKYYREDKRISDILRSCINVPEWDDFKDVKRWSIANAIIDVISNDKLIVYVSFMHNLKKVKTNEYNKEEIKHEIEILDIVVANFGFKNFKADMMIGEAIKRLTDMKV